MLTTNRTNQEMIKPQKGTRVESNGQGGRGAQAAGWLSRSQKAVGSALLADEVGVGIMNGTGAYRGDKDMNDT